MSLSNQQPFIDSRAFDKVNSTYVTFPSQSDAMLASLQLFHDVPCRIMNHVFSVITHPDFDSKQVKLLGSADVIDVVEESRLKDRMAVVQERLASGDGRMEQAGFPHFILDEVLDIIHAERMERIRARFAEPLYAKAMYCNSMQIGEDDTLKAMTRVHRSWTILAQKALGRVLHIGRPTHEMNVLLSPVQKSIFGPWTAVVAVQFYHPIKAIRDDEGDTFYEYSTNVQANDEYHEWFENLHRTLVGFTNLKHLYIKSYASLFTRWSNLTFGEMVRRNVRLEEVTLYAMRDQSFNLDPLLQNTSVLKNLRSLSTRGAWISDVAVQNAMQGPGFASLNHLAIIRSFQSLECDLALLSILSSRPDSRLESLCITDSYRGRKLFEEEIARAFTPSQCAAIFEHLRSLQIDSLNLVDKWFKWIGPYCSSLESLSIIDSSIRRQFFEENVTRAFTPTQCAAIFEHLRSLRIDSKASSDLWLKWIHPYCTGLQSLTLATNVSSTPDTLNQIPITIQSLDLALRTSSNTPFWEITHWMKCLLKIVPSTHFSKLNSFTLSLPNGVPISHLQELWKMKEIKEEMRTEWEGNGFEYHLNF